ncbi:MAG: adenylate cyclase-like protein, partial [uncultured bacterium]
GLIVLAMPLWFFSSLLETALQRTEDSAMALLREKLLQESERVKELMTPAAYVKETINKAHRKILPEVTQDLVKLRPEKDFGQDMFDEKLPLKMLTALHAHHLRPLFIVITTPEFFDTHYWFARELRKQCPEPDNLAYAMAYELLEISAKLYQQYYQHNWKQIFIKPHLQLLCKIGLNTSGSLNIKYLNRFGEIVLPHDTVMERFTDYFGRQSLYYYAYNCLSRENLHGAYKIGILQAAIRPSEILKNALNRSSEQIEVNLVKLPEHKPGFFESDQYLEFFDRPPTDFWNHFFFQQRLSKQQIVVDSADYHIRLRAAQPEEIKAIRSVQRAFRIASGCLVLIYLMATVHYWLFGFSLPLPIRRKLLLLLAVIIFIPVTGTGLLAMISLKGSDRVIENHVMEKTQEILREFLQYDDENDVRLQLAMLEIKRRLEEYDGKQIIPKAMLSRRGDDLLWMQTLTGQHTILSQNGEIVHYNGILQIIGKDSHKLINIVLPKFLNSLGLLNKHGNALSDTLALGLSEDYITPEREETRLPHESTLQQEISHTLDTSRATTILVQTRSGDYLFAFSRLNDGDINTHAYLGEFARTVQKWFTRSDPYCDVELGARLRRQYNLHMYAWPSNTLLNNEMLESFRRAIELKDSGARIIHTDSGIKANVWSQRPHRAAMFAAIGQSRGKGIGQLAVSMLFPVLTGYAILLIMVLSMLFAEFIIKPVNIFAEGIQRLSNEEYGVIIEKFSGDEFSLMTSAFNKMSAALRQREMIKRLVSKKLIEKVENIYGKAMARTEKVRISVVASDIRGFTTISEKYSPSEVVELLNTYFTAMEEAISANSGVIDKYIGDAIQAVYYDKAGLESSAHRACRTAIAMRRKLEELNRQRGREGLFALENGIGITTGLAVSGSIGSETGRKDFTIIGRITEQAAHLEAATINTGSRILVCAVTQSAVAGSFSFARHDDASWELTDAC